MNNNIKNRCFHIIAIWLLLIVLPGICPAENNPGDAAFYNAEGLKYFKEAFYTLTPQGKDQEAREYYLLAIENFKKALTLDQGFVEAHRNLARVYFVQKEFSKAAQEYQHVIALNPQDMDSYLKLASAYERMEHYSDAIEILEKAKTITNQDIVLQQLDSLIQKLKQAD